MHDLTRGSYLFSAIFHVAVLVFVFVGVPQLFARKPLEDTPIAVRLVTIAEETKATQLTQTPPKPDARPEPEVAQAKPEPPKPEPPKPDPPKPAPPPPPPPPTPPKPPEPPPEPKPAPPKPPEPPKAELPPEPKPETKPEPPKPVVEAPKPKAKPDAPKQVAKQQETEFESLLKNLTRQKTAPQQPNPDPKAKAAPPQQQASSQPIAPLGSQLTVSEKDLVIQQIEDCWSIPAGAKGAQDLDVVVHIEIGPDGIVRSVRVDDQARYAADPFFRAFADSATRAPRMPNCTPLKLPGNKFEAWKSIELHFTPKGIL